MLKASLSKLVLGGLLLGGAVVMLDACADTNGQPGIQGTGGAPAATGGGFGTGGVTATGSGGAPGSGGTASTGTGGTPATGTGGKAAASGGVSGGTGGTPGSGGGTTASGGSGPTTGSGGAGSVTKVDLKGKKVLFVVDDVASLSEGDAMLKDLLVVSKEMVVTLANTTTANASAATMNLIIASSGASGSEFPALYKATAVPIIVFGNGTYQNMGFVAGSSGKGSVSTPVMLTIVDGTTPLASALAMGTNFTAIGTTRSTSVYWGTPAGSPIKVAAVMGATTQLISFAYEKGAAMATGTAPARRVALGFKTDVFGDLSVESFKLVNAALEWTAGAAP